MTDSSSLSYEAWTELLCRAFYGPGISGRPAFLAVDDARLAALADAADARGATANLVAAIRTYGGVRGFRTILDASRRWRQAGMHGCPPALPLLAVAVIAASRMADDGIVRKTNYYRRFWEVFGQEGSGLFPAYDLVIPALWRDLDAWIRSGADGARGISTIKRHSRLVNIGYALSQALFRASDRQALTYFFHLVGAGTGRAIPAATLLQMLRLWAPRSQRFSVGAQHMIKDPGFESQVMAIVEAELALWDGQLRDERGRLEGLIRIAWDWDERMPITSYAERRDGFPETFEATEPDGTAVALTSRGKVAGWYDEPPLTVNANLLAVGAQLTMGSFSLRLPVEPVLVLSYNDQLGTWLSVGRFVPGQTQLVLTRFVTSALIEALESVSQPGLSGPMTSRLLPEGWTYFKNFRWHGPSVSAATQSIAHLFPTTVAATRLVGGLRLSALASLYLYGGEPDLELEPPEEVASLVIDRVPMLEWKTRPGASATDLKSTSVRLRSFAIKPGPHEVSVGRETLRFSSTEGLAAAQMTSDPEIWWEVSRPGQPKGQTAEVRICGAMVHGALARDRPESIAMPAGRRLYLLLGPVPGEYLEMRQPAIARRLAKAYYSPEFEVIPPFKAVWLLTKSTYLGWEVRLLDYVEPQPYGTAAKPDPERWRRALERFAPVDSEARALWDKYRAAARGGS
jgi:hypothetical protein